LLLVSQSAQKVCYAAPLHELLRENENNIERTDWKFRRVVEKF